MTFADKILKYCIYNFASSELTPMPEQLIINLMGPDKLGILSLIAGCISDNNCNILDSRHAIYGQDFSVSMIVNGDGKSITRLELAISSLCVKHSLLSMMKRTSGHRKQNLEQQVSLEFKGEDASGVLQKITNLMASNNVSISALRQKTVQSSEKQLLSCKMILSAPTDLDLLEFDKKVKDVLNNLGLSGQISHQITREDNEYIESW